MQTRTDLTAAAKKAAAASNLSLFMTARCIMSLLFCAPAAYQSWTWLLAPRHSKSTSSWHPLQLLLTASHAYGLL
jgi:hypothetical protein